MYSLLNAVLLRYIKRQREDVADAFVEAPVFFTRLLFKMADFDDRLARPRRLDRYLARRIRLPRTAPAGRREEHHIGISERSAVKQ